MNRRRILAWLVVALLVSGTTLVALPATNAHAVGDVVSDDFNAASLNTSLWTVQNGVGDGTVSENGSQLVLTAPATVDHDTWTNGYRGVGISQPVANGDFSVETKIDTRPTKAYQDVGIMVTADATTRLRFDFYSDGTNYHGFSATTTNNTPTYRVDSILSGTPSSLWLRVVRSGNTWTQSYSTNGTSYTTLTSFSFAATVTTIGPYVGNSPQSGTVPPAYTANIDYFHNTATIPPTTTTTPATTTTTSPATTTTTSPATTTTTTPHHDHHHTRDHDHHHTRDHDHHHTGRWRCAGVGRLQRCVVEHVVVDGAERCR